MKLESKEVIYILKGEPPFKGGERLRWQSSIFHSGLGTFTNGEKTVTIPMSEIYLTYQLEKNEFSEDKMIVESVVSSGKVFKLRAVEIVKN